MRFGGLPYAVNAAIHYRQIEITHMIENLVYLELLRRGYIVDIGKNRDKEIGFVAKELNGRQYFTSWMMAKREDSQI